jgi:hypothetical protein
VNLNATEIHARLNILRGSWRGRGRARFPTIDSAEYSEELTFKGNDSELLLHYEERTWRIEGDNERAEPLSWQSGFLVVDEEGLVQLLNAQNAPRVEVLTGWLEELFPGQYQLDLTSKVLAYDDRMGSTRRIFEFNDRELSYQMFMSTSKVLEVTPHLECTLTRHQES